MEHIARNDEWFAIDSWALRLLHMDASGLVEVLRLTLESGYTAPTTILDGPSPSLDSNPIGVIVGALVTKAAGLDGAAILRLCQAVDALPNFDGKANIVYGLLKAGGEDARQYLFRHYDFKTHGRMLALGFARDLISLRDVLAIMETNEHRPATLEELVEICDRALAASYNDIAHLVLFLNRHMDEVNAGLAVDLLRYLRQHAPFVFVRTMRLVNLPRMRKLTPSTETGNPVEGLAAAAEVKIETPVAAMTPI